MSQTLRDRVRGLSETVNQLCAAFDCTPNELFGWDQSRINTFRRNQNAKRHEARVADGADGDAEVDGDGGDEPPARRYDKASRAAAERLEARQTQSRERNAKICEEYKQGAESSVPVEAEDADADADADVYNGWEPGNTLDNRKRVGYTTERDKQLLADFASGMSRRVLMGKYKLGESRVDQILRWNGAVERRRSAPNALRILPPQITSAEAAVARVRKITLRNEQARALTAVAKEKRRYLQIVKADGELEDPHLGIERPRTRADCKDGPRPCPWISCKFHMAIDVSDRGALTLNFPDKELEELADTCALDVADRGEHTLEEIGQRLNMTRAGVELIVRKAMAQLHDTIRPDDLEDPVERAERVVPATL